MVLPDSVIRRLDCKSFSILPTISLEQPTSLANSKRVIRIWVHFFFCASGSWHRSTSALAMRSFTPKNARSQALRDVFASLSEICRATV